MPLQMLSSSRSLGQVAPHHSIRHAATFRGAGAAAGPLLGPTGCRGGAVSALAMVQLAARRVRYLAAFGKIAMDDEL